MKNIAYAKAKELGYDPIPQDKVVDVLRKDSESWIAELSQYEKTSINKYTFNEFRKEQKKFYEKINGYLAGIYSPDNQMERDMILRNYVNIQNALLKNHLNQDIIVFRKDKNPESLGGVISKFLSTSATQKGTVGGAANVAIIVPRGTNGAYIENLAKYKYKKQREFLFPSGVQIELLTVIENQFVYLIKGGL